MPLVWDDIHSRPDDGGIIRKVRGNFGLGVLNRLHLGDVLEFHVRFVRSARLPARIGVVGDDALGVFVAVLFTRFRVGVCAEFR